MSRWFMEVLGLLLPYPGEFQWYVFHHTWSVIVRRVSHLRRIRSINSFLDCFNIYIFFQIPRKLLHVLYYNGLSNWTWRFERWMGFCSLHNAMLEAIQTWRFPLSSQIFLFILIVVSYLCCSTLHFWRSGNSRLDGFALSQFIYSLSVSWTSPRYVGANWMHFQYFTLEILFIYVILVKAVCSSFSRTVCILDIPFIFVQGSIVVELR
jgi:hypothetical protein